MRRKTRSLIQAFANGLGLASLPVAAFLLVDYLVTPPTDQTRSETFQADLRPASPDSRGPFPILVSGPELVRPEARSRSSGAPTTATSERQVSGSADPRSALVSSIQQELGRVGCLSSEPDGKWSEATRAAMQAFNASVHVSLATDKPDYILLTLLQGHSARACGERLIEARAPVPKRTPAAAPVPSANVTSGTPPAPAAPSGTWSTTVVLSASGTVKTQQNPAAPPVVAVPAPRLVGGPPIGRDPAERQQPDQARLALTPEIPVPADDVETRMSLGVLPRLAPTGAGDGATPAAVGALPRPQASPTPRPRAASPAERPRPAPARSSGSRVRETFSDLGRASP